MRISDRLSTAGSRKSAPVVDDDDGMQGGKVNADGAVLPPWSCILAPKIRYQPTTLIWKVHEVPSGMQRALKSLDARRYQPMSQEHGLHFRLRPDAAPPLERICNDKVAAPREGVASPRIHKFEHPTWWGCGPKDLAAMKLTSSYDNHGENWQEQGFGKEQTKSIDVPRLDGEFKHDNPFMSQFHKRIDGGSIVYDTSVADKRGCCLRDPNLPKVRTRGW